MQLAAHHLLSTFPGIAIIKNSNSLFIDMSERCSSLLGWKNSQACYGKTDFDIPSDARNSASEFIKMDKAVIESGKNFLSLEMQQYDAGIKLLLVERQVLISENYFDRGIFIYCTDLTDTHLFNSYTALYQFDSKNFSSEFKSACYRLTNDTCSLPLTDKQQNCIFLLIRGKSIKQIAKILKISPRTVEDHIAAIGKKFGCRTKADVIESAIDYGFLHYIPHFFQGKEFSKII